MKNRKKAFFCKIAIMLCVMFHLNIWPGGLWNPAGTGAIKETDKLITKHAPLLIKLLQGVDKVSDTCNQVADVGSQAAVEASSKVGVEAAKELAGAANSIAVAVATVGALYSVYQLYPIALDIQAWKYPSEEQKDRESAARERRLVREAGMKFRDCMANNYYNTDRSASGVPITCEEVAAVYVSFGRGDEVEQTVSALNRLRSNDVRLRMN